MRGEAGTPGARAPQGTGTLGTPTPPVSTRIRIDHYSAVHLAATTARRIAVDCGLPGALPDRAAVLASELAANIAKHARDGSVFVQPLPLRPGVEIVAADRGPGIPDLDAALTDGWTTTKTLGAGLGAARRIASEFTLRTRPGAGTLICARVFAPGAPPPAGPDLAALCLPLESEQHCGDGWAVADTGDGRRTVAVVDGLGHGDSAAEATGAALRTFHRDPQLPLPELLLALHRALRHTRGAAVGLLRLRPDGDADHCSVGNVRAQTVGFDGVHSRATGQPGVVGWNMPQPRVRRIPVPPGSTLVLHSDGVDPRWTHDPSPFLLRLPPPLLVAALAHDFRRSRDDATVLATGAPTPPSGPAAAPKRDA
ncbi:anti-sigma regulatory factor [Streptomyces spiroverticillatus]|uniref:Anti-sigma regulatory factor n=1 Tax=Streptomyces finlayi TaxID=67296 RepID=A0A918X7M1_9ACTN|nr:SpoIIE family protein phosphatase [Streptomyces finlayi]GHA42310.1 anti-sigma regulatory factor [Streptomyces spiroverticillatus]GHD17066.1 anti-sigma regulatory factor [Streptomyces finlayi]